MAAVALKLLRRGLYAPEAQHQFRREQRALTALKRPVMAQFLSKRCFTWQARRKPGPIPAATGAPP